MSYKIHTLEKGELITEPGFYNIPLDQHHGQPCDGPSVTSGVLRRMKDHGPSKVWAYHALNPEAWPDEDTQALRLGRAMAALVEGGIEELEKHFMILPDDRPRRPTKDQLRALREGRETATARRSIAFWGEMDRDPRDKLSETEYELICNMGLALAKDPSASAALSGLPEITMAWKDLKTDLWCLARPDNVSFDGSASDYKKVNTGGKPFSQWLVDDRLEFNGYDLQMAFAAEGLEQLTGVWPEVVGLVFQEDKPPFDSILRGIPEEDLRFGQFYNHQSLRRFRECLDSGHWPGPGEHTGSFHRSEKRREAILEEMNVAGVAP